MIKKKIGFREIVGIAPTCLRFKQALIAFFGEEDVPRTKFGLSSLSQLHPGISPKMWRGKIHLEKKVIISNLFNHTQTPIEDGWSVQKSQTLDYRGKQLTYNSHNGTDFAIPVGTTVYTAAAGTVVAVKSEFNRGGLKIFIDHGDGLMTNYAHLARSIVNEGDILKRGQAIAYSGYSGLDGFTTFPFGIPHVHFNVWLNCEPIDPFPYKNQESLWHNGHLPAPADDKVFHYNPSIYDQIKVDAMIALCKTKSTRDRINTLTSVQQKAIQTIIEMNYYPTRFPVRMMLYDKEYARLPRLDLPFHADDFDGIVFLDDVKRNRRKKSVIKNN